MGKAILGALLAAVAMFAWGWLAWTPTLDLHELKSFEESDALAASLKDSGTETGVYYIPAMPDPWEPESEEAKAFEAKQEAGPRAMVVYRSDGAKVMDYLLMAKGFGLQFLACLLIAFLILANGIRSFFGRWLFTATIGLVLVVWMDGMNWVFFSYPDEWSMWMGIDHVAAFAIAGFVLALIVRPRPA